jgi:hypothetical protein
VGLGLLSNFAQFRPTQQFADPARTLLIWLFLTQTHGVHGIRLAGSGAHKSIEEPPAAFANSATAAPRAPDVPRTATFFFLWTC